MNTILVRECTRGDISQIATLGRLLMDAAVRHARDAGAAGVVLSVWAEAGWATAFYRGYGFRNLGEVPYFLGATEYVDWLMWLPISRAG